MVCGTFHGTNTVFTADEGTLGAGALNSGYDGRAYAQTSFGIHCLELSYGERNCGFGMYAGAAVTSGKKNSFFGTHAGNNATTANNSCCFGF